MSHEQSGWFPLQSESVRGPDGYKLPQRIRIPWSVAEKAYGAYSARYGRDQSLERLAERGGFGHGEMDQFHPTWREDADENQRLRDHLSVARAEVERLTHLTELLDHQKRELDVPEVNDFLAGAVREAAHQRGRWSSDHDAGKTPADWFWLLAYLAGKALHSINSGDIEKGKHHLITSAAALANWHAAILGKTNMRPGIGPPAGEVAGG